MSPKFYYDNNIGRYYAASGDVAKALDAFLEYLEIEELDYEPEEYAELMMADIFTLLENVGVNFIDSFGGQLWLFETWDKYLIGYQPGEDHFDYALDLTDPIELADALCEPEPYDDPFPKYDSGDELALLFQFAPAIEAAVKRLIDYDRIAFTADGVVVENSDGRFILTYLL